jgi:hypothetical protein
LVTFDLVFFLIHAVLHRLFQLYTGGC